MQRKREDGIFHLLLQQSPPSSCCTVFLQKFDKDQRNGREREAVKVMDTWHAVGCYLQVSAPSAKHKGEAQALPLRPLPLRAEQQHSVPCGTADVLSSIFKDHHHLLSPSLESMTTLSFSPPSPCSLTGAPSAALLHNMTQPHIPHFPYLLFFLLLSPLFCFLVTAFGISRTARTP